MKRLKIMKIYKTFKKVLTISEFSAAIICLYCWIINDFDSFLYDFGIKIIAICFCFNLCCFIFEKKFLSKSNK